MLRLALGSIRGRLASFSGAVIAIVFAASLTVACGVLIESALRSDIGGSTRFEAAAAVVQARPLLMITAEEEEPDYVAPEHPPVPAALVDQLGALPGVQHAVGDLAFYVQAVDPAGDPLANAEGGPSSGHAWSSAALTPFTLQAGQAPTAPDEVVLDADLAQRGGYRVGDRVPIITAAGTRTFTVAGIAAPPGRAGLEEQSTLFFSDATARELAPFPEGFSAIGLLAKPEFDAAAIEQQLRDALDATDYLMLSGEAKRDAEQFEHQIRPDDTIAFLGVAGGLTGFVTVFIVAGTFSFAVQQRGREIGLLRAVAATPRQIIWMIVSEAALVALVGSAIGSLIGLALVEPLRRILMHFEIASPEIGVVYGPFPLAIAFLSSLVIAELAVIFAARRAARIQPTSALREASIERRGVGIVRLLSGLLLGVGAMISFFYLLQVGGEAGAAFSILVVMALCVAGALLGPVLVWPVGWIVGGIMALIGGVTGSLARANVLANRRRASSIAVPLMLTACFATLFLFIGAVQEHGITAHTERRLTADYVVVSSASDGLPEPATAAIAALPEVEAASGTLSVWVVMNITPIGSAYSDLTDVEARGVEPETLAAVLDLGISAGALSELQGDTVAVSELVARGLKLEVGERVTLWLPDGTQIRPRVVAIYGNALGFGDIILPREQVAAHSVEQLNAEVFVSAAPGAGPQEVQVALHALRSEIPTLAVIDRYSYIEMLSEDIRESTRINYLIAGLAVIYTAIAIVNTLMMSISERVREFARLRMIGAIRRQVVGMVVWETAIIVVFGVGLGVGISLLADLGFATGMLGSATLVMPWLGLLGVLAAVLALGFGSSVIPAWLASRSNPQAAIGGQE